MARKPKLSQAEKSALKKLRERGLYKPKHPHKAPTSYAKKLIAKFSDVIAGKASVIKAGRKAASKFQDAGAGPGRVRSKGSRIIAPHLTGEKVHLNKKTGDLEFSQRTPDRIYKRRTFPHRAHTATELIEQLGPGDYISVPQWRGKRRGVGFNRYTPQEFLQTYVTAYGNQTGAQGMAYALQNAFIDYSEPVESPVESVLSPRETAVKNRQAKLDRMSEIMDRIIARRG